MKKVSSRRRSSKKKTATPKKAVYPVKNWTAYDQALVQRGSLTVWLSEEAIDGWSYTGPTQRGAQFEYSDLAIETALTFRKLFHLPLRQTEGFIRSLLERMDLDLDAPDHTTLVRRQPGLTIDLPVHATTSPRDVVVDSTGLKVSGEGEWKTRQHGWNTRRTWRKLHLNFDADTGEIVAETWTEAGTDDASQVRPMQAQIPGEVARFYADGAYDRWKVHYALADPYPSGQDPPIASVIPPRRDAQVRKAKRRYRHIEARNQRVQAIEKKGRKPWKQESGYHRRSLAETGIFRYKVILGPKLQARSWPGQQTEARIGCSTLNRMIHLGKPDSYKVEVEG